MSNYKKILKELIIESIKEDTEYQKLVKRVLDMAGVESPQDLSKDQRAKFFSYLDGIWDTEKSAPREEPSQADVDEFIKDVNESRDKEYDKFFRKTLRTFGVHSPDELDKDEKKDFFDFIDNNWHAKNESINEGKLPRQLELVKKKFLQHILKYGKVGSLGVDLTGKLDIVLYGPKPHHKDSSKYKHTDPALFIVIEDSRNKRVVQTDIVEFKSFDKKEIEKALDTALDQIYRKTSSKTISNESTNESKVRKVVRQLVREELNEEDYDRDKDARAMGYRNAKEADKDNWGRPVKEAIEDYERGDTAHVEKENKTGMVLKQYGQKVHLKFPNGKEKTYNTSELRKIQSDNINEADNNQDLGKIVGMYARSKHNSDFYGKSSFKNKRKKLAKVIEKKYGKKTLDLVDKYSDLYIQSSQYNPDGKKSVESEMKSILKQLGIRSYDSKGYINEADDFGIKYGKQGHVKYVPTATNKRAKEVTVDGKKYKYNSTYKTYNSVDGNELLHKSHIERAKKVLREGKSYRYANDAINDFYKGILDADELKLISKNTFGKPLATKQELEQIVNNSFMRDMVSDMHGVSSAEVKRKTKELLKKKIYEVKTNLVEARDESYYITYYDSQDPFAGDVVKSFKKFDKKKIEGIFQAAVDKYLKNEGDEIEFSKGLNNVIMTVELKDGKKMTQITKGSKTYYKPFRGFKGKG